MKRLTAMILSILLLVGCSAQEREQEAEKKEETKQEQVAPQTSASETTESEENSLLRMEMEHDVYDPSLKSFTYFIHNDSEEPVEFGAAYAIEQWKDGKWQGLKQKDNVAFPAILYWVQSGGAMALKCGFSGYKGTQRDGRYRLVKEVGGEILYAEFELGESPYSAETPYGFGLLEDLPKEYSAEVAAETDVVFSAEGIRNIEAVEAFLNKTGLGVDGQLRTVQDYGEGAPLVTDIIYEKDHFLWRLWQDGHIEEKRYSYIVTDGSDLYLSNGADWESTILYDQGEILPRLVPEGVTDRMLESVEQQIIGRKDTSVIRYKIWGRQDKEGIWSAALRENDEQTHAPTEFFVEWHSSAGGGRGCSYDLQSWDGVETAIRKIEWEGIVLILTFDTLNVGVTMLRFDPETEELTGYNSFSPHK